MGSIPSGTLAAKAASARKYSAWQPSTDNGGVIMLGSRGPDFHGPAKLGELKPQLQCITMTDAPARPAARAGRRRERIRSRHQGEPWGAERLSTAPATAGDALMRASRARRRTARWDSVSSPVRSTSPITETILGPTISSRR